MKLIFTFLLLVLFVFNHPVYTQSASAIQGKKLIDQADTLLLSDLDAAIKTAKQVLKQYDDIDSLFINATSILAEAYREKKDYDSTDYYVSIGLKKALAINDTANLIYFYTDRGSDYYFKAEYSKALADYKKSEALYNAYKVRAKSKYVTSLYFAKLMNNMATAYIKTGHYDSSLRCFIESIKIKEANHAPAGSMIVSKINIGGIYLAFKDFENSKIWLNKALQDAITEDDSVYMARCYANLGVLYKKTGDTLLAVENYKKALAINESKGDYRNQAIVLQNLALLLSSQKKYDEAYRYFTRALTSNNRIHANNSRLNLAMSRMFLEQQRYDSAIVHGKLALKLAKESGNIDVQLESYELLSKAYNYKKKYQLAFDYLNSFTNLKDSVTTRENQQYIQNLQTKFETRRKEDEIVFLKELNQSEHEKAAVIQSRQRLVNIVALLALALVIVAGAYYFLKKKKEKELYMVEKKLMETDLKNRELQSKELQTEVNYKARQLTTHALNMLQKNQILTSIQDELNELSGEVDNNTSKKFKSIIKEINNSRKTEKDWMLFKNYFESVNKLFNKNLRKINPNLSTHDCRLAALISLNLNIKETASLLNISPNSVKIARYRLRKRLNVETGEDLYAFLTKLKTASV